jgi:hypothetical protein
LEVFRYAKWDGIVGVGFTMESDSDHVGKSIIDRLINSDKCHDKVFIYTLTLPTLSAERINAAESMNIKYFANDGVISYTQSI